MLILSQSIEQFRETFPMLPLALIGLGMLSMLWLLRRTRKRRKAKPASLKRIEDRYSAAIREIGSIKMNQWMDKHVSALTIPRRQSPPNAETLVMLKHITAYQKQALARSRAKTGKTHGQGVS